MQLVDFVAQNSDKRKIALMAIIKEVGVDDEGLTCFHRDYFGNFAMYMDDKWQVYRAMGERKVRLWDLIKATSVALPRLVRKRVAPSRDIFSNAWMSGGVLVFDRRGNLVYALEEEVCVEYDMERIAKAVQGARKINASYEDDDEDMETDGDETENSMTGGAQESTPTESSSISGTDTGMHQ